MRRDLLSLFIVEVVGWYFQVQGGRPSTSSTSVSTLGATAPCSQRAITERSRPVRSASSACVRPARSRASRISAALRTGAAYNAI